MALDLLEKLKKRKTNQAQNSPVLPPSEAPIELGTGAAEHKKQPQDDSRRTRNEVLKLRLTASEKEYLIAQAHAAGMSVTDYLMACAMDKTIVSITNVPELIGEIRKQGINLNQVAKRANECGRIGLEEINLARAAIQNSADKISDFVKKWDANIVQSTQERRE